MIVRFHKVWVGGVVGIRGCGVWAKPLRFRLFVYWKFGGVSGKRKTYNAY